MGQVQEDVIYRDDGNVRYVRGRLGIRWQGEVRREDGSWREFAEWETFKPGDVGYVEDDQELRDTTWEQK